MFDDDPWSLSEFLQGLVFIWGGSVALILLAHVLLRVVCP